jgi:hypothetical protein
MADADPVPAPEGPPGAPPEAPPADPAPEVPTDPPGPTWDDLVAELGLEPHELAHQLLQEARRGWKLACPQRVLDINSPIRIPVSN